MKPREIDEGKGIDAGMQGQDLMVSLEMGSRPRSFYLRDRHWTRAVLAEVGMIRSKHLFQ